MIGKIGSGKTSWAKMVAGADFNVIRIGGDDIQGIIKRNYTFDLQLEPLVNEMMLDLVLKVLVRGKSVIIDDRHLDIEERGRICEKIKGAFGDGVEIVYVWVQCDDGIALNRRLRNMRGGSEFEWKEVMKKHNLEFTEPTVHENECT